MVFAKSKCFHKITNSVEILKNKENLPYNKAEIASIRYNIRWQLIERGELLNRVMECCHLCTREQYYLIYMEWLTFWVDLDDEQLDI